MGLDVSWLAAFSDNTLLLLLLLLRVSRYDHHHRNDANGVCIRKALCIVLYLKRAKMAALKLGSLVFVVTASALLGGSLCQRIDLDKLSRALASMADDTLGVGKMQVDLLDFMCTSNSISWHTNWNCHCRLVLHSFLAYATYA